MHLAGLWLTDFRCYREAELRLAPGVTVISGANAQGKTSLLEAVAWTATGASFRGVPDAALVRAGCDAAILHAEIVDDTRRQLLEAEIRASGRNRVQVNRQAFAERKIAPSFCASRCSLPTTCSSSRAGRPSGASISTISWLRRRPRYAAVRSDYERVLRQRNTLLRHGIAHCRRRTHTRSVQHATRPRRRRTDTWAAADARTPHAPREPCVPGARRHRHLRRRRLRVGLAARW